VIVAAAGLASISPHPFADDDDAADGSDDRAGEASCATTMTPPRMRRSAPATVAAGPVLKRSNTAGATLAVGFSPT